MGRGFFLSIFVCFHACLNSLVAYRVGNQKKEDAGSKQEQQGLLEERLGAIVDSLGTNATATQSHVLIIIGIFLAASVTKVRYDENDYVISRPDQLCHHAFQEWKNIVHNVNSPLFRAIDTMIGKISHFAGEALEGHFYGVDTPEHQMQETCKIFVDQLAFGDIMQLLPTIKRTSWDRGLSHQRVGCFQQGAHDLLHATNVDYKQKFTKPEDSGLRNEYARNIVAMERAAKDLVLKLVGDGHSYVGDVSDVVLAGIMQDLFKDTSFSSQSFCDTSVRSRLNGGYTKWGLENFIHNSKLSNKNLSAAFGKLAYAAVDKAMGHPPDYKAWATKLLRSYYDYPDVPTRAKLREKLRPPTDIPPGFDDLPVSPVYDELLPAMQMLVCPCIKEYAYYRKQVHNDFESVFRNMVHELEQNVAATNNYVESKCSKVNDVCAEGWTCQESRVFRGIWGKVGGKAWAASTYMVLEFLEMFVLQPMIGAAAYLQFKAQPLPVTETLAFFAIKGTYSVWTKPEVVCLPTKCVKHKEYCIVESSNGGTDPRHLAPGYKCGFHPKFNTQRGGGLACAVMKCSQLDNADGLVGREVHRCSGQQGPQGRTLPHPPPRQSHAAPGSRRPEEPQVEAPPQPPPRLPTAPGSSQPMAQPQMMHQQSRSRSHAPGSQPQMMFAGAQQSLPAPPPRSHASGSPQPLPAQTMYGSLPAAPPRSSSRMQQQQFQTGHYPSPHGGVGGYGRPM
eukprot:TRINITY_DN7055_c0_g3_i2.p1 TRINITY_DN7055_c0_g3~~TRINITY_DN7055_c0_g3_i2.p1  ORF type:complete len:756 (-),score=41.77 TRINITY_DN7055_c0_g3_i2:168-2357(-)